MSLEEKLQRLVEASRIRRSRYTEVKPTIEEALAELDRLREIEFIYQGLCK